MNVVRICDGSVDGKTHGFAEVTMVLTTKDMELHKEKVSNKSGAETIGRT
jgi:hypothetical protein